MQIYPFGKNNFYTDKKQFSSLKPMGEFHRRVYFRRTASGEGGARGEAVGGPEEILACRSIRRPAAVAFGYDT